jgi:hypothetical protein
LSRRTPVAVVEHHSALAPDSLAATPEVGSLLRMASQ